MRLDKAEIKILKQSLKKLDPDARLYLFGSLLNDEKRGGDIDLLIESERLDKKAVRKIRLDFYRQFGEQKLDIIVKSKQSQDVFIDRIAEQLQAL